VSEWQTDVMFRFTIASLTAD